MSQIDGDTLAVRKAARRMALYIGLASCFLVLAIVALAIFAVVNQSQPSELLEPVQPGEHKIYVDSQKILLALCAIGIAAIVFASAVSWFVAHRAVHPLGEALRLQRTFVADASHELRTPLAVLDARLQLLERKIGENSPLAVQVDELRTDSRTLIEIVNDLLLAAGGDPADTQTDPTDAVRVAQSAIDSLRVLADSRHISMTFQHDPRLEIQMPEMSFRRCVVALVDNAVNHSPDKGHVVIDLTKDRGWVHLSVTDNGPGIQGVDPLRIFDRFVHSESQEVAQPGRRTGFGIGLALVRDLAVRHGGGVSVAHTSAQGTRIVLDIPAS